MRDNKIYILVLSLLQSTVGVLAVWLLLTRTNNADNLQIAFWIVMASIGLFLGVRGMVRFFTILRGKKK